MARVWNSELRKFEEKDWPKSTAPDTSIFERAMKRKRPDYKTVRDTEVLDVVRLVSHGDPEHEWVVVRRHVAGVDLFCLNTGEFLPNCYMSEQILPEIYKLTVEHE